MTFYSSRLGTEKVPRTSPLVDEPRLVSPSVAIRSINETYGTYQLKSIDLGPEKLFGHGRYLTYLKKMFHSATSKFTHFFLFKNLAFRNVSKSGRSRPKVTR